MTSLREPTGLSPTTKSCFRATAATEEPRVEGKVHNSREGPVETAAACSAFSLPNPSSEDQELTAILLPLRRAYRARAMDCRLPRATRTPRQSASAPLGVGASPVSLTLYTIIKRSYKDESLFRRPFLLPFPCL